MRFVALCVLLALAACDMGPTKFSAPAKDAPGWDLNVGKWPGTNDLIHPPEEAAR